MIDVVQLLEDELMKELKNSKQTTLAFIKPIGNPNDNIIELTMTDIKTTQSSYQMIDEEWNLFLDKLKKENVNEYIKIQDEKHIPILRKAFIILNYKTTDEC